MELSGVAIFGSTLFFACLLPVAIWPSSTLRWFQRKRYQYEVTFGLYMLTATEKFILNSIFFIVVSLTFIAATLYLPEHLSIISSRALYYYYGTTLSLSHSALDTITHAFQGGPAGVSANASASVAAAASTASASVSGGAAAVAAGAPPAVSSISSALAAAGTMASAAAVDAATRLAGGIREKMAAKDGSVAADAKKYAGGLKDAYNEAAVDAAVARQVAKDAASANAAGEAIPVVST